MGRGFAEPKERRAAAPPATDPHLAFRRCIADAPDAEGPKLVYADFLDEQGDPAAFEWRAKVHRARIAAAPDDMQPRLEYAALCDAYGDGEQAEFIRLQVDLATSTVHYHGHNGTCNVCVPEQRCRALLARHGAAWARAWLGEIWSTPNKVLWTATEVYGPGVEDHGTLLARWSWHAGAPADFKVPMMATWRGRTVGVHPHDGGPEHDRLVSGLGAALVRAVPCRSVECGDKEPNTPPDRLPYWFNAFNIPQSQICEHDLPPDLFARLEGWTEAGNDRMAGFPTAALARAALSRVMIAEAWGDSRRLS